MTNSNDSTTRIFICGVGGLGTLTTAALVAKASLHAGHPVVTGEIHGMSQRGGSVETSVIVGGAKSPLIADGRADVFLGLEPLEALRYRAKIGPHTCVVVNTEPVVPVTVTMGGPDYPGPEKTTAVLSAQTERLITFNATDLAAELGDERTANTALIGAAFERGVLPFDLDDIHHALDTTIPAQHCERNRAALNAGRQITTEPHPEPRT